MYSMFEGEWRPYRSSLRRIGSRPRDSGACDAFMLPAVFGEWSFAFSVAEEYVTSIGFR